MTTLTQAAQQPGYEAAATAQSKNTIFLFLGTFAYMLFGTSISPGFIGGALFAIIGMFAASLAIAMPLMAMRIKLPKLSPLISIADIAITILATRWAYLWFFA